MDETDKVPAFREPIIQKGREIIKQTVTVRSNK